MEESKPPVNDGFREVDHNMLDVGNAFLQACINVNLKPTRRQFGKWQRKTGLAYQRRNDHRET